MCLKIPAIRLIGRRFFNQSFLMYLFVLHWKLLPQIQSFDANKLVKGVCNLSIEKDRESTH